MAQAAGERVAYYNGRIVPERDVRVPFRDRGFKYGDAVFDTTRTFGHRIFRLKEHLDRLYRSLRYLRIDPGIGLAELKRITEEVLHENLPLLEPDDDYWVTQRVTRGLDPGDRATFGQSGPTVIVECLPLPLRERATLYRDGIRVVVPSVRRAAPDSLSARTKTNNYLNVVMGDLEAKARDPRPGRSSSTSTATSPRESAATSSSSATAPSTRRGSSSSCRASAGRRPSSWRASSATRCTSATSTSSTPTTPTRPSSPRPASACARCEASTAWSVGGGRVPGPVTQRVDRCVLPHGRLRLRRPVPEARSRR